MSDVISEITVERQLTTVEAIDALVAKLREALGGKTSGVTYKAGVFRVLFTEKVTADDENNARRIVLNHDFAERTSEQIASEARKTELKAARKQVEDGKATKDDQIAYLLLEVAHLRERSGE